MSAKEAGGPSMAVLTTQEEQADREFWARRWAERYAAARHLPAAPEQARTELRSLPLDDQRLPPAAEDWRQVLAILGVDVPKPAVGTCRLCGKVKSLHEISGGAGPCQPCLRRLTRGARQSRQAGS
jgi:hypothetical protein